MEKLQSKVGQLPVLLLETFQNWGMTQKMTVISVKPKTVEEVKKVVKAIKGYNTENNQQVSLRCVGKGHSWSPLFPDDGNVLMFTSQLIPKSGERITLNEVCFCALNIMF
ncbi:L-gulonolactone oxidase-like [Paramuricea clavata]|uniref:L-gulonolactone oxidase-like n=1 Tax=Paramuricea clavata TaxID=317549 RepID=A0A6S7GSN6_PARCT|nr:L-gulonolactone oxidase-like [Paramuricea clavata]